jgi:hypothetical protein
MLLRFLFGNIAPFGVMNTTLPCSSLSGISEARMLIVSLPSARP